MIGLTGIERGLDRYLRGVPGLARVRVDSLGRPRSSRLLTTPPQPGQTVRLTINARLQLAAQNALQYGIQLARNNGQWAADGGAIVALSPKDGSILALASSPSYDPSVYGGRVTTRKLAAQGLTPGTALARNYPALDRALDGTYPPGSTFKPLTAIAGLEEHLIKPYAFYPCTGTYTAPEDTSSASRTTGTSSSTRGWICRRRSRSRATRTSTASPTSSICCRRTAASRSSAGPEPSGSGGRAAPTSRRRLWGSCRRSGGRPQFTCTPTRELADRPALEAGRLAQPRDRPGRSARDTAPDGPLLRRDRERREARHAARPDGRREPERDDRAHRRAARAQARAWARSGEPQDRQAGPLRWGRRTPWARRTACSATSRCPSPARPERRRRPSTSRASPARRTSRGGAAMVRRTTRRSSSAP